MLIFFFKIAANVSANAAAVAVGGGVLFGEFYTLNKIKQSFSNAI
jgi:hypothetical protein